MRGYLAGSGWLDYKHARAISGVEPARRPAPGDRLPAPIFTPSTKAELGTHDQNISFDEMIDRLVPIADDLEMAGALAERIRSIALALYGYGAAIVARAGILLADTKFEFGLAGQRRAAPDRRGDDARFVALLERRGLRARPGPGRATTSSSSATGSRRSPGTRRRRAPSCRPRSWPGPASATSRPTNGSPARASRRYLEEDVIAR